MASVKVKAWRLELSLGENFVVKVRFSMPGRTYRKIYSYTLLAQTLSWDGIVVLLLVLCLYKKNE